ncbi:MAG: glutamate--tRNA ligase [Actinomycetales bacterium]|nr:MAG: glutamate--tRNA ligase [Actinomycetales bacterium]
MTMLKTRFAPSPTGNLHLGGARTALINYIISKKSKSSKFYLRIEDTDKERSKQEYTDNITNSLKWLGLNWDEDIQVQSQRVWRHQEIARELLHKNRAFKCVCSEEKIASKRKLIRENKNYSKKICTECKYDNDIQSSNKNCVIRLDIPDEGNLIINDKIQGNVTVTNAELDDFILLRKDQTPTYMLSVVVDDHDLGINYIIRGDDHFINTFRQHYIYKFMNWDLPQYAHIPLIHGEDGSKLSKRHGAVNILDLKKIGYLKEAIINNLILLGWSNNREKSETIELDEIIENFEISNLSKSSSIFSFDKLNFFNNFYIKKEHGNEEFIKFCRRDEELNKFLEKDISKIKNIFNVYKKDTKKLSDLNDLIKVYFDENYKINEKEKFSFEFDSIFREFLNLIKEINDWDRDNIQNVINNFLKIKEIKFPILGKPIRFLLINSYQGPSISDIFEILGKKDTIERLNQYKSN